MNADVMQGALNAIYDEAVNLLNRDDLPEEVEEGLGRIIAAARYNFEVRTSEERLLAESHNEKIPDQG